MSVRVPLEYAGRMTAVHVGDSLWPDFDAAAETVEFAPAKLTGALVLGMSAIAVDFAAPERGLEKVGGLAM